MAKKVRIELVSEGFDVILGGANTQAVCEAAGQRIASEAGDGFQYFPDNLNVYGHPRTGGFVDATTGEAMRSEAEHKSLTKAVHA